MPPEMKKEIVQEGKKNKACASLLNSKSITISFAVLSPYKLCCVLFYQECCSIVGCFVCVSK